MVRKRGPVPKGWRGRALYLLDSSLLNPITWAYFMVEGLLLFIVLSRPLLFLFQPTVSLFLAIFVPIVVILAEYQIARYLTSTPEYAMYLARVAGGEVKIWPKESPLETFGFHAMAMRRLGEALTLRHLDDYIRISVPEVRWDTLYRPTFDQAMRAIRLGLWKGAAGRRGEEARKPFRDYADDLERTLKEGDEVTLGVWGDFVTKQYSSASSECQKVAKDYKRKTTIERLQTYAIIWKLVAYVVEAMIFALIGIGVALLFKQQLPGP